MLCAARLQATIFWSSACTDQTFCLNPGSCTEGKVLLTEQAYTTCGSTFLVYSYKIDLFSNNTVDMQESNDSIVGAFPKGTHRVTWKVTDNCGSVAQCSYSFTIKDCQPPSLLCINGLTQDLGQDCNAAFMASQFIINYSDNCTPKADIDIGMQIAGAGTTFPGGDTVSFGPCDLGLTVLEIWARDGNGLINKCQSYVIVQENSVHNCKCNEFSAISLGGCVRTAGNLKMEQFNLRIDLSVTAPPAAPKKYMVNKNVADSCFLHTFNDLPAKADHQITVRASRTDNPLAGFSTYDLVLINRHILNLAPFTSFYQMLAADVNKSSSVTTFDIVEGRKLLLGIYDTFPSVPSWRLIRPVNNPNNILSWNEVKDSYQTDLQNLFGDTLINGFDFMGIKMGDVNLSATFAPEPDDRNAAALPLQTADRLLQAGETALVPLRLAENAALDGWQLALGVKPALATPEVVEGLSGDRYFIQENGILRLLEYYDESRHFQVGDTLFVLKIKARQSASLREMLALNTETLNPEAYTAPGASQLEQRRPLTLRFEAPGLARHAVCFPPQPNPFASETRIGLLLEQSGEVLVEVFDFAGRPVFVQKQTLDAGYQRMLLPAEVFPATGVYVYRISTQGAVFSGQLACLK